MTAVKKQGTVDINMPLFKLAWPVFVQALLSMVIGYADSLMLTKYSDTAVGAVGNANQILGFLTLAFTIITSATGVIVSQYLGAKKTDEMGKIHTAAVSFNVALSVTVSAIVFVGSNALLWLMQVPDEMMPDASAYLKIVGGLIFLDAVNNTLNQILRCNGKVVFGMVISLVANVLNIGGNFLFLYGPLSFLELGATGVAIASVCSRFIALIVTSIFFHLNINGRISLKYLYPLPTDIFLKLIKLGVPTAGENISYNLSQIIVAAIVNSLGTITINTKIYCNILTNFAYLYSISVAMATQIIVGHAVGAGKYDFAHHRVYKSILPAEIISVGIAVINFLISPVTLAIFTDNQEIIALGREIMFIAIFLEIGRTCNLVIINSMRAAGDVKFPTYLGIASNWGISVLFAFVLGKLFGLGLAGIWIAMALDEIFRGIVVLIRWQKGSWRNRSVVKQ